MTPLQESVNAVLAGFARARDLHILFSSTAKGHEYVGRRRRMVRGGPVYAAINGFGGALDQWNGTPLVRKVKSQKTVH